MRELAKRLSAGSEHLNIIDKLFSEISNRYSDMKGELVKSEGYKEIVNSLYGGQVNRQMVLSDLLVYILTGRGYWIITESEGGFTKFLTIILRVVNLLLEQESILTANKTCRKRFLRKLKKKNIPFFFVGTAEKDKYSELVRCDEVIMPGHRLYKVMDSLLPKSIGTVKELLVYSYLLNRSIGYVVPLLLQQRLFFKYKDPIPPPDFLLVRPNQELYGIEVGTGTGRYGLSRGKVNQVNQFTQETNIPVLTVDIPNLYRCEKCGYWFRFCREVIDRFANGETDSEFYSCVDCEKYNRGRCPFIIYNGRIEVNGDSRRYHYYHVRDLDYAKTRSLRKLEDKRKKLIHYYPVVTGIDRLPQLFTK